MHGRHPAADGPRLGRNDAETKVWCRDAAANTGFDNEPDTVLTSLTLSTPSPTESLQWMTGSSRGNETVPRVEKGARGSRSRVDDVRSGSRSDDEVAIRVVKRGSAARCQQVAPFLMRPRRLPRPRVRDVLTTGRASGSGDGRDRPRARWNKMPGEEAEQVPRQRVERQAALSGLRLEQQPVTTNAGVRNEGCQESDPQADAVIATTKRRLWRRLRRQLLHGVDGSSAAVGEQPYGHPLVPR